MLQHVLSQLRAEGSADAFPGRAPLDDKALSRHSRGDGVDVSGRGRKRMEDFGIDFTTFSRRQPIARTCLDWSMRRPHLGGALGRGLLSRFYELGWAKPASEGRAVVFSRAGRRAFEAEFLG